MGKQISQPMFSIISVIKNIGGRRAFFHRCVESVLKQTYSDFEFIIQDGGSTDNTLEMLSEYDDPRILVQSEPDSVHAEGMFRALKRCRGKYIGSCWSDEELLPDALEKAVDAFAKNPQSAAIYGDYWLVDEKGSKSGPYTARHPFSIAAYACQHMMPPFCSSFFSRDALERAGLHNHPWRYGIGEYEFWIRLANVGPITYVPTDFSHFGRHAQSDTNNAVLYDRLMRERVAVMADLFQENRILRDSGVTVKQAIAGNYAWAANSVFSIEGASQRYQRFVEKVRAYEPDNPHLPYLIQRLPGGRSPARPVEIAEQRREAESVVKQTSLQAMATEEHPSDAPYVSLVVATRNDDHGGNIKQRFQCFLDHLGEMCTRHRLPAELIVVEWNPVPDRLRLLEAMRWPDSTMLDVRIVTVPPHIHAAHDNADKFPLFQMIAKNVGIRRARGQFLLATNVDLLFSDELCAFLARRELNPDCWYRIDRHDIGATSIPEGLDWEQRLRFCEHNIVRVHARHGTHTWGQPAPSGNLGRLHANACGDFTLMATQRWLELEGYPEFHLWSIFIDGLLVHAAAAAGLKEVVLRDPCRLYHIEHDLGWAKTTEPVKERPSLDYTTQYVPLCRDILAKKRLDVNKANWGLADIELEERRPQADASSIRGTTIVPDADSEGPFAQWIDTLAARDNRLYYRDQSAQSLARLAEMARRHDPTVIVELGTLAGLSLRTWLAASPRARVVAVDLSFATLNETRPILPVDLSRVTLVERDILQVDFASLWTAQDRVVLFVDAHDLPNVPIMKHVLTTALPALEEGSVVVVDDLWYSEERLTRPSARAFLENRVLEEIDELQCFEGHFAPYHGGGSFMGFAEVIPLLSFVNRHGIPLVHEPGGKHAHFVWKKEYLYHGGKPTGEGSLESEELSGSVAYNPQESVPTAPALADTMRHVARLYRQRNLREAIECLSQALRQHPGDEGLLYGLAVCLARGGLLSQARDILARNRTESNCLRYRRLYDDLVRYLCPSETRAPETRESTPDSPATGELVYTLSFTPEQRTYQRLPRLIDPSHRALFAQDKSKEPGYLSKPIVSEVQEIQIIRHRDCILEVKDGSQTDEGRSLVPSDYWEVLPDGPCEIEVNQPVLPWFYSWGSSWQHFLQDSLSVLAGCREYLQAHPKVAIAITEPDHDCVPTLLQQLGITNRVYTVPYGKAVRMRCRELLAPRVLPDPTMWGWPPELYRRIARRVDESLPQDLLIYTTRRRCTSRRVKNEKEVIDLLRKTAEKRGLKLLVFDASEMSPPERVAAFQRARAVVGPHGGANYHVLFCRPDTPFVEFCFYRDMHTLYNIAVAANVDYWMLPVDGGERTPEAEVDIELLNKALRSIFANDEPSTRDETLPGSDRPRQLSAVFASFSSFSAKERLRTSQENYNIYSQGSAYQKERIASVAECCVREHPGDIIEIGCYVGETTRYLCQVARRHGRRVIAVDPWEIGTQNCQGGEYEAFLKSVEEFRDIVDIVRLSSLSPDAIRQIRSRELAFAFVDGLHNYEACLSDIRTVSHCHGVIAVDDTRWSPGVRLAFFEAGAGLKRCPMLIADLRESYLLADAPQTCEGDAGKRVPAGAQIGSARRAAEQPGLTIFAMPKAFAGHNALIQKNAIRSWARLDPRPEIILFGDEPGIKEMAEEVGARHMPDVERNEFGTPRVDKLFDAAQKHASHPVLTYVNADMILMQDFAAGVQKVQASLPDSLLIGQRWDLSLVEEIDFDQPGWQQALRRQMAADAIIHAESGLDYFVFRKGLWPHIPPFAIGRTAWDNWLVLDPRQRGVPVADGSEFITAVHQDHDYGHMPGGRQDAWRGEEAKRNHALAGAMNGSGLASDATHVLNKEGTLLKTEPRQPWCNTGIYKDRRSAWLLEQANKLLVIDKNELAACKCEEALMTLGYLLALKQGKHPAVECLDGTALAQRYTSGHILLAQCYWKMGRHDQAVTTYTCLLQDTCVTFGQEARKNIENLRERCARLSGEQQPSGNTTGAGAPRDLRSKAMLLPSESDSDPVDRASQGEPLGLNALDAMAIEHGTDKISAGHDYMRSYHRYFAPLRKQPLKILEIGVNWRRSLKTWQAFFERAEIYGVDTNPACRALEGERIHVFIGDQADPDFLRSVVNAAGGSFDIIIDDGGHFVAQQITSFDVLLPYVSPGGIYVIEDLHTSYSANFGEGLDKPDTTVGYLKGLVDIVNRHGAKGADSSPEAWQAADRAEKECPAKQIESIEFCRSICFVVKKKTAPSPNGTPAALDGCADKTSGVRPTSSASPKGDLPAAFVAGRGTSLHVRESAQAHNDALADLEAKFEAMPYNAPGKHVTAIRLAELCRRIGQTEKNDAYALEARTIKNNGAVKNAKQPAGQVSVSSDDVPRPKVTVVTACHNAERYLAESVESVCRQSLEEWELLLLDDGSTDGTRRLIEEYARRDPRIKAFCFDTNAGPYVRRNLAIERAASDFIVIHDADDLMMATKLETLYNEISQDDSLAMVGSFYRIFFEDFKGIQYTDSVELPTGHENIVEKAATWQHGISHISAIIRKSMFERIGGYDENPFASDGFWSAKLAEYCRHGAQVRLRNIPDHLTLYRVHDVNQTQVLSMFDPRNRRVRYRAYCQSKLERVRKKMQSVPSTDIERELRSCVCSDFLTRFKAHIIKWENEPLDPRVIETLLRTAVGVFKAGCYTSCVNVLNGAETLEPAISQRIAAFDLLRGMAFFALDLKDRSLACLRREIDRHGSPVARKFMADAFERKAAVEVSAWCRENAQQYDLDLTRVESAEPQGRELCGNTVRK